MKVGTNITTISFGRNDEELLAWLKEREGNPDNFGGVNIRNQLHELMVVAKEAEQ